MFHTIFRNAHKNKLTGNTAIDMTPQHLSTTQNTAVQLVYPTVTHTRITLNTQHTHLAQPRFVSMYHLNNWSRLHRVSLWTSEAVAQLMIGMVFGIHSSCRSFGTDALALCNTLRIRERLVMVYFRMERWKHLHGETDELKQLIRAFPALSDEAAVWIRYELNHRTTVGRMIQVTLKQWDSCYIYIV